MLPAPALQTRLRKVGAQLRAAAIDRLPIALSLLALIATAVPAQSRPESAASRPVPKLSVRQVPFPIKHGAGVPAACSFSPDGRFLAIAYWSGPQIYDFKTKQTVAMPMGNANWPPAFNPRSDRLAVTVERGIALLHYESGEWRHEKTAKLPVNPWIIWPDPRTLAWSSDGAEMVYVEWEEAHQISWPSGETRKLDCGRGAPISAVALDRSFGVSTFADGGFETAILSNGTVVDRIPDIQILTVSGDQSSWLVAKLDRAERAKYPREKSPVVEVWDAKPRRVRARLDLLPEFSSFRGLCHAVFSSDGSVLVTGTNNVVDIRDGRAGAVLHTISLYEGDRVVAVALSPDGKRLLTMGVPTNRSEDGTVLWELSFE